MAYFNPKYFNVYFTNYHFNKSIVVLVPPSAIIRVSLNINKRQDHGLSINKNQDYSLDINKNTDFSVFR